jgi:hypothetical protein
MTMHTIDLAQLAAVIGGQNQTATKPAAAPQPEYTQSSYFDQGICPAAPATAPAPTQTPAEDPIAKFYRRGGD